MKGAVLAVLYAVAVTRGAVLENENGCPIDYTIEKLLPHPNCGQYYQCLHGQLLARNCVAGLHFNAELNQCDYPASANCPNPIIVPENPIINLNDHVETLNNNRDENSDEVYDVPIGNNNDDPSQATVICTDDDSNDILVAHENCNQFYICTSGAPITLTCAETLLFDPRTDRCEWPDTVDCGERVIPETDDNAGGGEWIDNGGAGNDDPSQAPAICAGEGSDNILVAHENCNQYYQCWAGLPVELACPPNLLFNPSKDYCDFADNVNCGSRRIVV